MSKRPSIGGLKHRVCLCTAHDVSVDQSPALVRETVVERWAAIREKRGSFLAGGMAIMEPVDKPSHVVTVRFDPTLDIGATAWVYERRGAAPPKWFKVLEVADVEENGRWHALTCRLVQASDAAAEPVEPGRFDPQDFVMEAD